MTADTCPRRRFLTTATTARAAALMGRAARAAADTRPNIIFMFADDQAKESMGYTGNPVIQTPNMDRLAADGVSFENAFVRVAASIGKRSFDGAQTGCR